MEETDKVSIGKIDKKALREKYAEEGVIERP